MLTTAQLNAFAILEGFPEDILNRIGQASQRLPANGNCREQDRDNDDHACQVLGPVIAVGKPTRDRPSPQRKGDPQRDRR